MKQLVKSLTYDSEENILRAISQPPSASKG
jgi:hypothetical protein